MTYVPVPQNSPELSSKANLKQHIEIFRTTESFIQPNIKSECRVHMGTNPTLL